MVARRETLIDDYENNKRMSRRAQSTLPRMPFQTTSDLAQHFRSISSRLSPAAHKILYAIHVGWIGVCVPTFVFRHLVTPGLIGDGIYQVIWAWLIFIFSWQMLENVFLMTHHIRNFYFPRPQVNSSRIDYPPATAIIVAYLPNEADLILETLAHFRALNYEGELNVILAYNTPHMLPVEHDIAALQKTWPEFTAIKVSGSTSKCDNVNAVLSSITGTFVGIFDSDHLPSPNSFELAWRDLLNGNDVVQGRTKINPKYVDCFMSRLLAGEFEVRHGVEHGLRCAAYNYAVFGGSNGFWRTDVLQFIGMDPCMLTEDIDSSIRAMSYGYKIAYNHNLISLEQPPPNFNALFKQRLRWSQGWYQVSWRSFTNIFFSNFLSTQQKIGFNWMCKMVLPCQLAVAHWQSFMLVCLTAQLGFLSVLMITSMWAVPQLLYLFFFAELPWKWKGIYLFSCLPLMGFFIFIDLVAQVRLCIGYSNWHVTTRKKVDRDETGYSKIPHPPLSPSTFRYSPSSVSLLLGDSRNDLNI